MNLLFVDTGGATASVAIGAGNRVIAEATLLLDRKLSTRLLAVIDSLLGESGMTTADLDGFGVTRGPGSFTGIRIGMATVMGMASAAGRSVVGISSLALIAANLPFARYQVCALMDARKKEVYAGLFHCGSLPKLRAPECVLSPEIFLDRIREPTIFTGDGAAVYRELIEARCSGLSHFAPVSCSFPRAASGIVLALEAFDRSEEMPPERLEPVYIRPSEAEVAKAGSRLKATG
jgi:tRNA threonylcarbamoyladenosine biosynthesis protein TsaB